MGPGKPGRPCGARTRSSAPGLHGPVLLPTPGPWTLFAFAPEEAGLPRQATEADDRARKAASDRGSSGGGAAPRAPRLHALPLAGLYWSAGISPTAQGLVLGRQGRRLESWSRVGGRGQDPGEQTRGPRWWSWENWK